MKHNTHSDIIVSLVLISLLLIAGLSVSFYNHRIKPKETINNTIKYNGFSFYYKYPMWLTQVKKANNLYTVPFRFLPEQVENISVNGTLENFTFNKGYLTFNPFDENRSMILLGVGELSFSLAQVFGAHLKPAYTQYDPSCNSTQCPDVINCENTNASVVLLQTANRTAILYKNNHCIVLQGKGFELIKSIDKLLYMMYGIIR